MPASTAPTANPADFARLAGMSDEKVKEKTGCTWEKWVYVLDRRGAEKMTHKDIAVLVHEKYGVSDWWSQTITVGYERIKGLRARGQRMDGTYEAHKSRTFPVAVKDLFEAWSDPKIRKVWLEEKGVRVRTATPAKSMRLAWPDGTVVSLWFEDKGASKSTVAVQHTKLADAGTADRLRKYWSERLDALAGAVREGRV